MPIKAVLFDMDGVLLNSEPLHDETNLKRLSDLGVEADSSVTDPYVGRTSEALWKALRKRFQLEMSIEDLMDRQWDTNIRNLPESGIGPSDGLCELLQYLRDNHLRATVASSSRGAFVEVVLDYLGISSFFEGYTCGEEIKNSKPAPDIFLLAAKKMGVLPSECLVIEDSSAGVRAGKAAGMFTIGYVNPTSEGQDVSSADITVSNLADVRRILAENDPILEDVNIYGSSSVKIREKR